MSVLCLSYFDKLKTIFPVFDITNYFVKTNVAENQQKGKSKIICTV